MPSFVTPKINTEYIFYVSLVSQADTKLFQANPTIAAGDFKVSTDGAAEANLTTLPVVTPAASKRVKITVSTTEMNGDNVSITASDAAGAEWSDLTVNIQTSAQQIDDLSSQATQDTIDTNVDSILVDTGTTIPAQITALNDVAATDIVSAGAITTLTGAVVNVDLVDTTTTNTDQRGTDSAFLASSAPANFSALGISVGGAIDDVVLCATTSVNTDMRGTDSAATAANLAIVDTNVDAILVDTGTTIPASLVTIDTNVDAILVDTGTTLPAQITALNDITVADILTTAMTESYAGKGVAPSITQAILMIHQQIGERGIVSITETVRKLDGIATAGTFTLDDATDPNDIKRAT